jgi:hypothetical protein
MTQRHTNPYKATLTPQVGKKKKPAERECITCVRPVLSGAEHVLCSFVSFSPEIIREFKLPVSDGSSSPVCRTLCDVIVETRYATLLLLPGKPEPLFLSKYGTTDKRTNSASGVVLLVREVLLSWLRLYKKIL